MKKFLLLLIVHCVLCLMHCVKAQDKNVVLYEDFENGILPTWSQEKIIGDFAWTIESGSLENPKGTVSGMKRVAFRNTGNQTTGNITRLMSPVMDLSGVFQPILCFSYAQPKWAGDIDTLRVLYRRTPNSGWVTLKKYDVYSSDWQRDTIRLVAVTSTYQVAFEGKDALGRGIVIDDVEVRSVPNCTQPFNLMVSRVTGTSARLEWAGSFDALKYRIEVNSVQSKVEGQFEYEVDGVEYGLDIEGLVPGTDYQFRVKSICVGEESDWSEFYAFRTSDMLMLPYYETFDMDYVENTTSEMPNWFSYSSKRGAKPPFVNTNMMKSERLKYSPDSTTALFFHGALNVETAISKSAYSYTCVPEIYVDSIKKLQVSFWTINYVTDGTLPIAPLCRLMVGVMSDPENINTFVAVDTVEITSVKEFEEVFVSFENYTGTGKYITFMSYFKDDKNAFVIDDLKIDYIPVIPKAEIEVALPESDALEVRFKSLYDKLQTNSTSLKYEVVVANAALNTESIDSKKVIARGEYNTYPCRVEGLKPWVNYFVYGRVYNDTDTGAWSNGVAVLMPEVMDSIPTTLSFDINTFDVLSYYNPGKSTNKMCLGLLALSNSSSFPETTQQYWTEPPKARSPWELSLQALKADAYQMLVFPELEDMKNVSVSFYVTRHLQETAAFAIGIVSDANNVESFQAIDTIVLDRNNSTLNEYTSYKYKLGDYDVNGRFFAIKAAYNYCGSAVRVWIDDVRFYEGDACGETEGIQAKTYNDAVTISWTDNGASSWNVLLSETEYSADVLDGLTQADYFAKQTTKGPSITFSGLKTGEKKYYYYIQSNCNGKLGVWTLPQSFVTECPKFEKVPYVMNFDEPEWLANSLLKGFTVPCLFTVQTEVQGAELGDLFYYPHLSTATSSTGEKSLLLADDSYIAFPLMNDQISKLQISFDMKADSAVQVVEVGVMSNPLDVSTFEAVKEVTPSANWDNKVVKFTAYSGESQYIAIRTSGEVNMNYIDNVMISYATTGGEEEEEPKPEDPERPEPDCTPKTTFEMGVEGFDTYGFGEGKAPDCYIVANLNDTAPAKYIPYCSDEYAYSGAKSLKLSSTPLYNGSYAITPEIDIKNISNLRVRFRASLGEYFTSQYAGELTVAIVTDVADLGTQTNIKTLKVYPDADLEYEVRFDEYIGDADDNFGRYVMFMSYSKMYNTVFIDDVVFDTIPECVSPKVEVVESEVDYLSLRLHEGGAPYQVKYIVGEYSKEALGIAEVHEVPADGNFKISGLTANSDCFVMVRSTCSDGYSEWSPANWFRTPSNGTVKLPYYDSFTQNRYFGEYNNPFDWATYYSDTESVEQYRYPYVTTDRGGDNVVYLYSDKSSAICYMVTPKFEDADLSKCQVSFNYRPDVASAKSKRAVVVGVVSDISSKDRISSTFQAIDTIFTQGTTSYQQCVVSLAEYKGSAKYVALMVSHSLNRAKVTDKDGTYGGCYIDDVLVEEIPTCQRPINFKLTTLGDTYAKFTFSHLGATKYEVKYGYAGFDVETSGTSMLISDTSFTISGLQPSTEYDFYVRAYCSDTDFSEWSLYERYVTFEVPVSTFPYENKFDNDAENKLWKFTTHNFQLTTNCWYAQDSLYLSSDNGKSAIYANVPTKTWAYRTFDLKEGVYTVSFDWMVGGDASDYMRVLLVPALSTFVEGSAEVYNVDGTKVTLTGAKQFYPTDWVDLNREGKVFNNASYWNTYSRTFMITPEMAGFYRLLVYWVNDNVVSSSSAIIDNLFIDKSSCSYPYKFEIEDINSTYLTVAWTPVGSVPKSYNVVAMLKEGNPDEVDPKYIAYRDIVTTNRATITGLTSNTDYYIYVQANCDGESDLSYWSDVYRFTTPCDPKPLGTVFSFELDEGYYLPNYDNGEANTSYRIPDCFVNGHSNAEEFPYIKDNTVSYPHSYMSGIYQVARTGDYALKLYSNSEEMIGGYMALPLIDGNFDELQVSFWIRPFGSVKGTDNINSIGLNAVFARKITVGTMTNPNDPSTFEPLQVVSYPYTTENHEMASGSFVYDDAEGTNYWRKHSVLLKGAKGKFIAFKNEMYDGKENNQMYIDDVVVDYISDCMTPSSAMIEEATATTARLNATTNSGDMFEVQISKKEDCSEIWRTDTISGFPATITNLLPGQEFYMRVKQICGPTQQSDWSSITNCITAYTTLYSTDLLGSFNTNSYTPRHWQRACGTSAADIFSKAGSAMVTEASSPLGWTVKDGHLATYVTIKETRNTNPFCWIFSPSVELPTGEVMLSFNLALTDDDGIHKPDSTIKNDADKFYVVISDNNGRSWEEQNKFTWTNDGSGDYDYNAIPVDGETYMLDLTKYAGKVIRIAFYSECQSPIASELHIRDVRINAVINKDIESTICETEDYYYEDFVKLSTEVQIGENRYVHHQFVDDIFAKDTICNIKLHVKPLVVKTINATICSGDVYAENKFEPLTRAGVYKRKFASVSGCDSIVVVNLTVNPIHEIVVADTICFGGAYSWNGAEYNRTGMYVDTLTSSVTGCDSIVTLLLKVKEAPTMQDTVEICSGESYLFGSQTITESGLYTETFKTLEGCDSVVTLFAKVSDKFNTTLNEFICTGETYSGNGFNGIPKAGTYTLPLTSVGGCDSTIVLNLIELKDDTIYVKQQITTDDLPYTFATKVYDGDTEVGVYTDEVFVEHNNCSSVVVLTLEVGEPVDVENIVLTDLVLYPNPVSVGESIYIEGDFTQEELNGMHVEVYTMLGSCIYSSQISTFNAQFSIDNRGLYIVRLVAGNGTIYQGKIIVK